MCLENYWNSFPEHLRMYLMMVGISDPSFIKPDQLDPWIKDQLRKALLSAMFFLQLLYFVLVKQVTLPWVKYATSTEGEYRPYEYV